MGEHRELAKKLRSKGSGKEIVVGFDGFIDVLLRAVRRRSSPSSYEPFSQIVDFGQFIQRAGGRSANVELVQQRVKVGGNAPILSQALVHWGHSLSLLGTLGLSGQIAPLFQELCERCQQVINLGNCGHSEALEFDDGKLILGQYGGLLQLSAKEVFNLVGEETWKRLLNSCHLFVSANWTMLPMMTELWELLLKRILPQLSSRTDRWFFVDLADPAKRSPYELKQALLTLKAFSSHFCVVLGLNVSESEQVALVLGEESADEKDRARRIREHLDLDHVVIHATRCAFVDWEGGTEEVKGPYCDAPLLTTGAGDNFNAGYCQGLLLGLPPRECALSGVCTSGYYVRQGRSPSLEELVSWVKSLEVQAV